MLPYRVLPGERANVKDNNIVFFNRTWQGGVPCWSPCSVLARPLPDPPRNPTGRSAVDYLSPFLAALPPPPHCAIASLLPASLAPPDRFAAATFKTYRPTTPSQSAAWRIARTFAEQLRPPNAFSDRLRRFFGASAAPDWHGLYFVGPVGTGKTHLIAAMYHALHPDVPCAFLHSSTLFRTTAPPPRYAEALAARCDVLCLDEVEIDDPANEVRLVGVLKALDAHGVKLLATSNVTPEQFMGNRMSSGRFERFLQKEFAERYRLVFVGGADYRAQHAEATDAPGRGWIGPPEQTETALRDAYRAADGERLWLSFDALRDASRTTAHERLIDRLVAHDHLFVADIALHTTDDALRLLRIVDDLYVRPDAPRLYFSAATPPKQWFHVADQGSGLAADVAEKFTRTASRLHALCDIHPLTADETPTRDEIRDEARD